MTPQERRARDIQAAIREVLQKHSDPIGIADEPAAQHEYAAYVGGVYRLLASGAAVSEVAAHLSRLQGEIGLSMDASGLLSVASLLCAIDVTP